MVTNTSRDHMINSILNGLSSTRPADKMIAMLEMAKRRIIDKDVVSAIRLLKSDNTVVLGRYVSNMAIATLDYLGVQKYTGKDQRVIMDIDLITSQVKRKSCKPL